MSQNLYHQRIEFLKYFASFYNIYPAPHQEKKIKLPQHIQEKCCEVKKIKSEELKKSSGPNQQQKNTRISRIKGPPFLV